MTDQDIQEIEQAMPEGYLVAKDNFKDRILLLIEGYKCISQEHQKNKEKIYTVSAALCSQNYWTADEAIETVCNHFNLCEGE